MTKTEMALARKLGRIEAKLGDAKRSHNPRCVVELDPEGYAPCNCGASTHNASIEAALRELRDNSDL